MDNRHAADEDRDVIVHVLDEIDASTGARRERWLVFLGKVRMATHDGDADAIRIARELADKHNRPAWLLDKSGHPLKPIATRLTMRVESSARNGEIAGAGQPTQYGVSGLPDGQQAMIAERNGQWQIRRRRNGVMADWIGDYASAEIALGALERQIDSER